MASSIRGACLAALLLAAAAPVRAAPAAGTGEADLVLLHGRILTEDPARPTAEALAVRGGRVLAVGDDRSVARRAGPRTRVIDLAGRTATPGLIDTHAHILETGEDELYRVGLSDAASVEEIAARVARRAASARPGEWIVGAGWDEGKLAEGRYPTAAELDRAAPDNPVWLEHTTGHYGVANTRALELAGLGGRPADIPAGTIERLPDGRAAGVLKEAAQGRVEAILPADTPERRRAAIVHMLDRLHAEGMTGFKDPRLSDADFAAYLALAAEGRLTAEVCGLLFVGPTLADAEAGLARVRRAQAQVRALPASAPLRLCGVKLFLDGSGAAPTAWSYADWSRGGKDVPTGNRGYPARDPEVFRRQVRRFVAAGVGVGTHAIGDRAIDWAVDSYAEALAAAPRRDLDLTLIHANTPTDHALDAIAALQRRYGTVVPESQPGFAWWIGDVYAANLGPRRAPRLNPFATYARRGIVWAGGSDAPVTPFAARYGLWAAAARETLKGTYGRTPFGLEESVDVAAALGAYTRDAAARIGRAGAVGVLRPGAFADVAVWDQDPLTAPLAAVKDLRCEMTLFRGRVVFTRADPAAAAPRAPSPG